MTRTERLVNHWTQKGYGRQMAENLALADLYCDIELADEDLHNHMTGCRRCRDGREEEDTFDDRCGVYQRLQLGVWGAENDFGRTCDELGVPNPLRRAA